MAKITFPNHFLHMNQKQTNQLGFKKSENVINE